MKMPRHWPSDRVGKAKSDAQCQMDKDIFKEIIETKKKLDDLNYRISNGMVVEKVETEEEATIINEALKILGQDFRIRQGDRIEFIKKRIENDQERDTCVWAFDVLGAWRGTCGIWWSCEFETPKDNGMNFCPRCGKRLKQKGGENERD